MRYRLLGRSGLRVSELALGSMTFGEDWGWGASKEESRKIFETFVEAGGNLINTGNRYTNGTSERYVGQFVASERDRFVLATKYTLSMHGGDPNAGGNHRKNLVRELDASLKRLNTEYVDLYWVHAWDFLTPVEEVMRALDDVVRAGKVLYVGISDAPAWVIARANTLAELKGWTPFVGLQARYGLIERTPERDLLPMARALDIGVLAWSPLGGGVLTGKYERDRQNSASKQRLFEGSASLSERNLSIAAEVQRIAAEVGRSPSQVALNWVRQQNGTVIPVVGASKVSQVRDNLACLDFELSEDQLRRLEEASGIELGFPHDFLSTDTIKDLIFGDTYSSLDVTYATGR
jgi:aryl-alcohol dehydrogenase-like predicted oxidoreductase